MEELPLSILKSSFARAKKKELREAFCALRMYKMLFKKGSRYAQSVPGTVCVRLPVEASQVLGIKWLSFQQTRTPSQHNY